MLKFTKGTLFYRNFSLYDFLEFVIDLLLMTRQVNVGELDNTRLVRPTTAHIKYLLFYQTTPSKHIP